MRCIFSLIGLSAWVILLSPLAVASVIYIPTDQPTIQTGIYSAFDGDTTLVSDGTYSGYENSDIDFSGKAIVRSSENGPDFCTIDCLGSGSGFIFQEYTAFPGQ